MRFGAILLLTEVGLPLFFLRSEENAFSANLLVRGSE